MWRPPRLETDSLPTSRRSRPSGHPGGSWQRPLLDSRLTDFETIELSVSAATEADTHNGGCGLHVVEKLTHFQVCLSNFPCLFFF